MNQITDPEIFRFLTLSLAPVFIIGIWVLAIKLSRKTQKDHDKSKDWKF
jgi:hypothetical protein